jgi:hypothetical protein
MEIISVNIENEIITFVIPENNFVGLEISAINMPDVKILEVRPLERGLLEVVLQYQSPKQLFNIAYNAGTYKNHEWSIGNQSDKPYAKYIKA